MTWWWAGAMLGAAVVGLGAGVLVWVFGARSEQGKRGHAVRRVSAKKQR